MVRLRDLDLTSGDSHAFARAGIVALIKANSPAARGRLVELIRQAEGSGHFGESGVDETLEAMRGEMRRAWKRKSSPMPISGIC